MKLERECKRERGGKRERRDEQRSRDKRQNERVIGTCGESQRDEMCAREVDETIEGTCGEQKCTRDNESSAKRSRSDGETQRCGHFYMSYT